MNTIIIIVSVLFMVYILDKIICTVYCKMKKKKDAAKIAERNGVFVEDEELKTHEKANGGKVWKISQLLHGWIIYRVARLGRVPSQAYRRFILKNVYQMNIAEKVVIYGGFFIRAPWNISIGKGTIIGNDCSLDGRNGLIIGENVNLSTGVCIYTEQHEVNDSYFRSGKSGGGVVIDAHAWISSRTTILPKVHVGEGAVLASGALTAKDLDAFGIYTGIPAKKIGERNKDLRYEFDGEYLPFI